MRTMLCAGVLCACSGLAFAQAAGGALWLDGINDEANVGTSMSLGAFTVEAWVDVSSLTLSPASNGGSVLTFGNTGQQSFSLWLIPFRNPDGTYTTYSPRLQINYSNGTSRITAPSVLALDYDAWQHVAVSYDGSTARVYSGGVLRVEETWNTPINWLGNSTLSVGREAPGASEYIGGRIDELRVWSRVLSEQEIADGVGRLACPDDPDLFAYWNFNGGAAGTAPDATGGGRDLTLQNGAFLDTSDAPLVGPDVNGDGVLDNGDIGGFVALFLAGDLAADLNGDSILDNGDIGAFVAAFLAGC